MVPIGSSLFSGNDLKCSLADSVFPTNGSRHFRAQRTGCNGFSKSGRVHPDGFAVFLNGLHNTSYT